MPDSLTEMTGLLKGLKTWIKALRNSDRRSHKLLYHGLRGLWKPVQFAVDPRFRSVVLLPYRKIADLHQFSNMTWDDRYPDLFATCARLLANKQAPALLSYGCSTGQEVRSLRRYLPTALILGVDINRWNLKKCARLPTDSRIHFGPPAPDLIARHGPFDAIFCMAVLQRPENRDAHTLDSTETYPFDRFDQKLVELDSYLRPGGYFIIDGTDYRFMDASIASRYQPAAEDLPVTQHRPVFSPQNRRLPGLHTSGRIFQKQSKA